jgi:hypothetical protein
MKRGTKNGRQKERREKETKSKPIRNERTERPLTIKNLKFYEILLGASNF